MTKEIIIDYTIGTYEELEQLKKDNQHLLDLQKSMDKQYEELEQENQQLKSVLDEIREYIENGCLEEKELTLTCIDTNKIKQILDKVKQ